MWASSRSVITYCYLTKGKITGGKRIGFEIYWKICGWFPFLNSHAGNNHPVDYVARSAARIFPGKKVSKELESGLKSHELYFKGLKIAAEILSGLNCKEKTNK